MKNNVLAHAGEGHSQAELAQPSAHTETSTNQQIQPVATNGQGESALYPTLFIGVIVIALLLGAYAVIKSRITKK
jgi:hypothetical protein